MAITIGVVFIGRKHQHKYEYKKLLYSCTPHLRLLLNPVPTCHIRISYDLPEKENIVKI